MVDFEKFRRVDGGLDWQALDRARIEAGELCSKCRAFVDILARGVPRLCTACAGLNSQDAVDHDSHVRCPQCGHAWEPEPEDGLHEEGEHPVTCGECEHDFEVSVRVGYTFNSPARITYEDAADAEGDED
jgi:hypothetical protein